MIAFYGIDDLRRSLFDLRGRVDAAQRIAVLDENIDTLELAITLAPRDTGLLRESGFVTRPERAGGQIECVVGFGADYAVYVHERTEIRHPVGQAKFLETAVFSRASGRGERLATTIRGILEQRGAVTAPSSGYKESGMTVRGGSRSTRHKRVRDRAAGREG